MRSILKYSNKNEIISKQYNAFTLAEVLITLGIIGIVAALTIPTLINNVQNQQYVSALKKFYTTMENGFEQMLANDGVDELEDTTVFSSNPGACNVPVTDSTCQTFWSGMQKYFKFNIITLPNNYKINDLTGNDWGYGDLSNKPVIVFSDGTIIFSETLSQKAGFNKNNGGHMQSAQGNFAVDINGLKKPNQIGRDIFKFYISGNGKLYAEDSIDVSLFRYSALNNTWQKVNSCGNSDTDTDVKDSSGFGCAARIIESGWQMKY